MPTHGSLSKAGKVRSQTPRIRKTKKKKKDPRARNRRNYKHRIIYKEKAGQRWKR